MNKYKTAQKWQIYQKAVASAQGEVHTVLFFLVASPKTANLNFLIKKFLPFFSSSKVNRNSKL